MRAELSSYLAKWRLELEQPFETNSSQLAYVKRGETQAVLKIRVLEHDGQALLIERAMPGTTLAALFEAGRDEDATHIWCDVVQQLHAQPAPEGWPDLVQRGRSFLNPPQHPLLPPDLVAQAREEYFTLCESQSPQRYLLHADLNHFNILKDNARGWVVIDPKGFVGELAWETGTFLRNPIPHWDRIAEPSVLERRVRILCDRLGFNSTRVLRWCAAEAVLSCIWSAEGYGTQAKLRGAMRMYRAARLLLSTAPQNR